MMNRFPSSRLQATRNSRRGRSSALIVEALLSYAHHVSSGDPRISCQASYAKVDTGQILTSASSFCWHPVYWMHRVSKQTKEKEITGRNDWGGLTLVDAPRRAGVDVV